ncbi:SAM-dependent chlorinase/fluorinase [Dactylosporangium sp. AC04546]|uniref:SAM hydrolase/SAM-dependent halogenase family protein n=1 Tax=Dactylosporangium sp. AC04546 TaxID=2862460 RepID=UPI001EE0F666|nr:SAM-dependent chlorinase/fluorinase [Dactylosporangium sp. AC04546]WVK85340.1 SAM-dependent chlorinase/fluorinase [Dactylosporangium sp. AC04546]
MVAVPWISFTTDYGLEDGFVAACHGVIAQLAPSARIIDVTHLIPPGDIRRASLVLAQTVPSLPAAVHLAVVDPGVGTARRPIAIRTNEGHYLVGPDNGLLVPAAEALGGTSTAVHLTNSAWFCGTVSATFHGRDIFAPVAARLARGDDLSTAGEAIDDLEQPAKPYVERTNSGIIAEVLTVDRFGNVQLATTADADVTGVNGQPARSGNTFGAVEPGELVVVTDSAGYLSVAVNRGSAAERLNLKPGDRVTLTIGDSATLG